HRDWSCVMAKQDEYVRYTIRVPRPIYDRISSLPGEGSINARIVNAIDAAASGKTLRDEFAMAALIGMLANGLHPVEPVVGIAYSVADLMLAERKKGGAS